MTTTNNDITGDKIKSKSNSEKYRSGWDQIDWNKCPSCLEYHSKEVPCRVSLDEGTQALINMFENGPSETITLSNEDFDKFVELIENPPEPSEKLKKDFDEYKEWKNGC